MASPTKILISPSQFDKVNRHWGRHYKRMYLRGLLLRERNEFTDNYRKFTRNIQKGPLTPDQVAEITTFQETMSNDYVTRSTELDVTKDLDESNLDGVSSRFKFLFLLQKFLKDHAEITTVCNIGARVDQYSSYLALRFPHKQFISEDFQTQLALHNSLLPQSLNWRFMSGYWLDLIRSGQLKADIYFTVSTSVLMNNKELNVYLDEVAKHAKAVAFCEGWWARVVSLSERIVPPEDVPKERPYRGGEYANYHHNYIAKLEERGFSIILSQIVPQADAYHYLQIIAIRP